MLEIGSGQRSLQLCVTDYTTHPNLRSFRFGNESFDQVAFEITVWGDAHAQKLAGIEAGDRILLEVVAPKVGKWENQFAKSGDTRLLEGQVGDQYNNFKVMKLDASHPEYQVLSQAQKALGVTVKEEEADPEPAADSAFVPRRRVAEDRSTIDDVLSSQRHPTRQASSAGMPTCRKSRRDSSRGTSPARMNDTAYEGACLQQSHRTLITSYLPSAAGVRPSEQPARAVIENSG